MTMCENKIRKKRSLLMSNLFWLLVPERPFSELYILAGNMQEKMSDMLHKVEMKKTEAVDALYYSFHEGEDV